MEAVAAGIKERIGQAIETLESGEPLSEEKRHKIVDKLKESEHELSKVRLWIQSAETLADIGVWEVDHQNDKAFWSEKTYHILGYSPEEQEPSFKAYFNRIHPEDQPKVQEVFNDSLENNDSCEVTYRIQLPNGQIRYVESHSSHYYNEAREPISTICISQEVTDRERGKQQLEQSLDENQTLLGEIHHRVKNNLAVVAGLLQLQWLQEDDPKVISTLKEGANRMRAVAGIHEQLYESDDYSSIALGENITSLATDIIGTMESEKEISLESNCDVVHLNISQTLPCTLIANEVVTNSIKHAFEGKEEGTITIDLTTSDDLVRLEINDNGVGLPDDFNSSGRTLGMDLIETLSDQLDADYNFSSSEKGTTFSMQFQKEDRNV
ncbi:sensor histidine kinase [Fodinibius sp. AD559]|uniref:sensor histidine kinase n=1 Tax=Fodinibius sp. AD559 TaxID=3424179 RepID=UPI00404702B6